MTEFEELGEYARESVEAIREKAAHCQQATAESWRKANPITDEEIIRWYQNGREYLYELAAWHSDPEREKMIQSFIAQLCGHNVFDFGGGTGSDAIAVAEAGFQVTYCDLPSPVFDYACWRFEQRSHLGIRVLEATGEPDCIYGLFDNILCVDVLEHLTDVPGYMREFAHQLKPGGHFLWDACWGDQHVFPCHLERNRKWEKDFPKLLTSVGMEIIESGLAQKT